jgi:circadian clock protein KaiC
MITRLPSGSDRLDHILGGGLPANAINLIIGAPGSGKTILSQQYAFYNATLERPALYLSTVSEPFDKILRYAESLDFFEPKQVGKSVFYEDLGATLTENGLEGVRAALDRILRERRPGLLVIDSFKALRPFASGDADFRRFLHDLAGRFSAQATSTFWVGEYGREQTTDAPEFAIADAILSLSMKRLNARELRVLQVVKLRGSGFAPGEHAYRLSSRGLDVFPRLADPTDPTGYALGGERVSSGVAALDSLLGDGYWPGSVTLLAGPSGVGKTLMGLHFIIGGATQGDPGIIASLEENRSQLGRLAAGFGWSLPTPGVEVMSRSPVDMHIDEWVYDLLDQVEQVGARRVFVDSLADLILAAGEDVRFREWMYSLTQRFSRLGVSLMMTLEVPELFEVHRLSENAVSYMADNVVLLQYIRGQSEVKRAVTVLKTRASQHDPIIREFRITSQGFELGDRLRDGRDPA